MLSTDLENLAVALEQMTEGLPMDKATFVELVCNNLHSLAQRVEALEAMPIIDETLLPLQ